MRCARSRQMVGTIALFASTALFAQQAAKPAVPAPATTSPAVAAPAPISGIAASPTPVPAMPSAPPQAPAVLRYAVVLDAAHGGTNLGALLSAGQEEKALSLELTNRLRAALSARGIPVILTRDTDTDVPADARAQTMNRAHAAACISVHATSVGNGVHLFTSALAPSTPPAGQRSFIPWQTAQAASITQSLRLESELNTALTHAQIPVLLGRTNLMPLESAMCPAVAMEIAPLNAHTSATDPKYLQQIVEALAAALTTWRADWRMQP